MNAQFALRAATNGRHKLVYDMAKGTLARYDLKADPAERHDVSAEEPRTVAALREQLFAWLNRVEGSVASPESLRAALQAEEQLRSLGYLAGPSPEAR